VTLPNASSASSSSASDKLSWDGSLASPTRSTSLHAAAADGSKLPNFSIPEEESVVGTDKGAPPCPHGEAAAATPLNLVARTPALVGGGSEHSGRAGGAAAAAAAAAARGGYGEEFSAHKVSGGGNDDDAGEAKTDRERDRERDGSNRTRGHDAINNKLVLVGRDPMHPIVRSGSGSLNNKHQPVPVLSKAPLFANEGFFARREGLQGTSFARREKKLRRHSFSDTNLMLKMTEFDHLRNLEVRKRRGERECSGTSLVVAPANGKVCDVCLVFEWF
jgi:hypothetical protein